MSDRIDQLSDRAQWFLQNFDEIDLADICASHEKSAKATEVTIAQLRATLDEVLRHFVHKGHPGEPCLSSGWVSEKTVARWRAVLYPPKGQS